VGFRGFCGAHLHYTIDFLAIWEQVNNESFKPMGYHGFKTGAGRLLVSPKRWIETAGSAGIHTDAIKAHIIPAKNNKGTSSLYLYQ